MLYNLANQTINIPPSMVAKGLQYAPSKGIPEFLSEIKILRHNYHGISNLEDQIDVCVSVGSQNGLEMLLSSLINPSDGILLDEPCYPGTKAILGPLGANMIGVETDSDGMNLKDLIKKINYAKGNNINLKVRFILELGAHDLGLKLWFPAPDRVRQARCRL